MLVACQSFHGAHAVVESGPPFPQWIVQMSILPDGEGHVLLLSNVDCLKSGAGGSVFGASCG